VEESTSPTKESTRSHGFSELTVTGFKSQSQKSNDSVDSMSGPDDDVPEPLPSTQPGTLCFQDISFAEPLSAFWNFYPSAYADVVPIYPARGMTLKQAIRQHYGTLQGKRRIMYGFSTPERHCTICPTYPKLSPTPQPLYTWIDNPEPVERSISGMTLTQQKLILQRLAMKKDVVEIDSDSVEFPVPLYVDDSTTYFFKANSQGIDLTTGRMGREKRPRMKT